MTAPFRSMLGDLWYLLFPAHCLGCEDPVGPGDFGAICSPCRDRLPVLQPPLCTTCGIPVAGASPDGTCSSCRGEPPSFAAARAMVPYEPLVQDLVHAFKYHGALRLSRMFAELMARTYREHAQCLSAEALGEVPLHPRDARRRGRNHAAELARLLARRTGIPRYPLLRKVRATAPQARLDRAARARNVCGAYAVPPRAPMPRSYLLVDDVLTTGATAEACAHALRAAGVERVTVLTLARTLPSTD